MEPGTIADWANVGVAAAALVAAAVAGFASLRLMRVEQARDLRDEEHDRRAQASSISAWGAKKGSKDWTLQLLNGSTATVFDVVVSHQTLRGNPQEDRVFTTLPPGAFTVHRDQMKDESGQIVGEHFNLYPAGEGVIMIPGGGVRMVRSIKFTDAFGCRWERTPAGLKQLPS